MSWTPWTTSVPFVLVLCAVLAWWFTEPKTVHLNLIVVIGCMLFFWAVAPELAQQSPAWLLDSGITIAKYLHLDYLVLYHANMLVVGGAVLWLAHRAWQTVRKPVPELINILGVDVPDAPDVSLAGIRPDAATLHWTRPRPNRPVGKFLIQVNGVLVGESASQETAITVTGLKPDHFYNIRVIAVGHNNFQAGSRVIRLHTYSKDGRPELGNGRLPSNFVPEELTPRIVADGQDEDGTPRSPAAGLEAAPAPETLLVPPSPSAASGVARRNTLTRKHSPSTTSMDQSMREALRKVPEESLQRLGEKFEIIRKEMEETQAQMGKEEKEHKEMMQELTEEKNSKRRILKDKDDTTEKLKKEMGATERAMRSAQQKKAQVEKRLKDKRSDHNKFHDDMAKWEKEKAQMRKRMEAFEKEKESLQEQADEQMKELRVDVDALQASLAHEEAVLKDKGRELKEAEEQRKMLPGGEESDEYTEQMRQIRREGEMKCREAHRNIGFALRKARAQEEYENVLRSQLAAAQQSGLAFSYNQANSSGVDFDISTQTQLKRRSRNGASMSNVAIPSPVSSFAMADRTFAPPSSLAASRAPPIPPGFAAGPYMDLAGISEPLDEEGFRALTGNAPLSPTATSLLPAGMLDMVDYEPPSPDSHPIRQSTFGSTMSPENDPHSPASSGRSLSISSPRSSSQHLPFSHFTGENSERRSLKGDHAVNSPGVRPPPSGHRFSILPWLHRGGKAPDEPPALGTLKPTQSQSLPRTDESDTLANKRRISLSGGWSMFGNRNSAGPDVFDAGAPGSRGLPPRRLGALTHASNGSGGFAERDPSSPRPVSIASSDLPRPSTDSGSIWGKQAQPNRFWSPEGADPWSSRNASRRPSLHGSPSLLKTTLADADDEILDDSQIRRASTVGVIGSKPPSKSQMLTARLNPAAPSFASGSGIISFLRPREKESKDARDKIKGKIRDKGLAKDKTPRDSLIWGPEAADTPSLDESPSESRKSRDAFSVDTPSITESRESLSLDQSFSNTPSEPSIGLGLPETGLRKLLRKGSSSKFSLSSIRAVTSKKGPGSVANSDTNHRTSFDIDEHAEDSGSNNAGPTFGRGYDSVSSSPSIGVAGGKTNGKEGRVGWGRFSMKKKPGKDRESLEVDQDDSVPPTPSTVAEDGKF